MCENQLWCCCSQAPCHGISMSGSHFLVSSDQIKVRTCRGFFAAAISMKYPWVQLLAKTGRDERPILQSRAMPKLWQPLQSLDPWRTNYNFSLASICPDRSHVDIITAEAEGQGKNRLKKANGKIGNWRPAGEKWRGNEKNKQQQGTELKSEQGLILRGKMSWQKNQKAFLSTATLATGNKSANAGHLLLMHSTFNWARCDLQCLNWFSGLSLSP